MTQESLDEQRVLDELEQLQLAIRATRAQRERVQAEFDAQLRAFDPPAVSRAVPPPKPAPPTAPAVPVSLRGEPDSSRSAPVANRPPVEEAPRLSILEPGSADALASSRSSIRLVAITAGLLAVASLVFWMFNRASSPATQPVEQRQTRSTSPEPPLPEVRKPVAPPVDPHLLRIDLKTVRRVWLRVSVDGRIAIEREVAADEQLPFGADRSIVVRAGDAGAVTVRVGGVDQGPIGQDGEVVTRTFTPPAR